MDPYHAILMVVLAFFLVFLNGFFVLSEFAIVKVRKTRLEELAKSGNSTAKLALQITDNLDSYLSATQLGITLSSLALGWVGEPAIARILSFMFLGFFEKNFILLHTASFIIAFLFITLLHVILGEIVPKSIALAKSETCALFVAYPLRIFWLIFYPAIKLFDKLALICLRALKITKQAHEDIHTEEELKLIVGESLKGGFIDHIESEIIKNAVDFSDTTAEEIMTPRKDMICLDADASYEDNIKIVLSTNFTCYPYFKGSKDNILGVVHIRDFLKCTLYQKDIELSSILKNIMVVPEGASIAKILKEMGNDSQDIALVVDEWGGTAGLITMEDIIEEVMGDVGGDREKLKVAKDGTYQVDGILDLEKVQEDYGLDFGKTNQVTIGGYVFNLLGKLPKNGDKISDGLNEYEILEVEGNRIKKLRIRKV